MYDYMIVDGNSILYAAQAGKPLSVEGIGDVQSIYHSIQKLKSIVMNFPAKKIIWLWDGKAQFRYDLYPDYKLNRRLDPEDITLSASERKQARERQENKEQMKSVASYLEQMLTALGIDQYVSPDFEADDLAGYFTRKIRKGGRTCLMVTGDADWQQLVAEGISWYDPRSFGDNKPLTLSRFKEVTGFDNAAQFLQAKAMLGDKSDSIPSMPKFGKKKVEAVFREYPSVKALIEDFKKLGAFRKDNSGFSTAEANAINTYCQEWLSQFLVNVELMNLVTDKRDQEMSEKLVKTLGVKNPHEFEYLCRTLRFLSVIRNLRAWYETFSVKSEEKVA